MACDTCKATDPVDVIIENTFNTCEFFELDEVDVDDVLSLPIESNKKLVLTFEEVRKDISHLLYAFDNSYMGKRFINPLIIDKARCNILSILANPDNLFMSSEVCEHIAKAFEQIPDNHLQVYYSGHLCNQPDSFVFPSVGENISNSYSGKGEVLFVKDSINRDVPVITFGRRMLIQDEKSLSKFRRRLASVIKGRKYPAIIIDLRGNGGGNEMIAHELAKVLYGQDQFPVPRSTFIELKTKATLAYTIRYFSAQISDYFFRGELVPSFLYKFLFDAQEEFALHEKDQLSEMSVSDVSSDGHFDAKKAYKGNIYVLIDRLCGSACEVAVEFMEGLPNVTLVGENTSGTVEYGPTIGLTLPESGIEIYLARGHLQYKDGRRPEKIGYAPNMRVNAGEDALQTAIYEISKL